MAAVKDVVAEVSASAVAATILCSITRLDELINSKHVYVSECRSLKVALGNLLDVVNNLKEHEEVQFTDELLSARIYATKTYALLDKIASRCKTCVYWKTCISWITCCWLRDAVPEELEKQQKEAESLANEFPKLLPKPEDDEKQPSQELSAAEQGGVHTLELTTGHNLDCSIKRGKTLSFDVTESSQPQQVAYTVKTWLRNPKSWLWVARRLSATVERKPQQVKGAEEEPQVLYEVRLPDEKPRGCHPAEYTAFVSTPADGTLHALLRSVLPEDTPLCLGWRTKGAGTLLRRGHLRVRPEDEGARVEYVTQSYAVELQLTGFGVQGLVQGGTSTRLLQVEGKKMYTRVEYRCFVKKTGEVLAIYRHNRSPCLLSTCCGGPASGVVQFLGVGRQPQLRDLILSTFVAMGLTSEL